MLAVDLVGLCKGRYHDWIGPLAYLVRMIRIMIVGEC